jgi:glutamine cyclotransferase
MLNEMEIIDNYLYINLYLSYSIAKVNPYNNFVAEKIFNFEPLVEEVKATPYYKKNRMNYGDCLNGIAYNNKDKKY